MVSCESHCILNNYWIAGWSFNSRVVKVVHIYAEGIRLVVLRFIVVGRKYFSEIQDYIVNAKWRLFVTYFETRDSSCQHSLTENVILCRFRSLNYWNEQMAFKNELMLNTFQNKRSFNLFCKIFLIENTFVALPYQWMAWIAGLIPWPLLYSAYREWRVAKRCLRWS